MPTDCVVTFLHRIDIYMLVGVIDLHRAFPRFSRGTILEHTAHHLTVQLTSLTLQLHKLMPLLCQ